MLTLDGAAGEGGGQLLRSSLALSLVTGQPFTLHSIRARRSRPGLQRQHLTAVLAAAAVGQAEVTGASLGSSRLTFRPGRIRGGDHTFAIGTAGSTTLVLQTILPALALAGEPARLLLEGGTHNPLAPPFEFLDATYLPRLARMGLGVRIRLERPGFYPAGGGRLRVEVDPPPGGQLRPLDLLERGPLRGLHALAVVARLPRAIAQRELAVVAQELAWTGSTRPELRVQNDSSSPGNYLALHLEFEPLTEVCSAIGERGKPAEQVAAEAVAEARRYLAAEVPVGVHLADQLPLLLALAGGGSFRTLEPSQHTRTQLELIPQFLPTRFTVQQEAPDRWRVEVHPEH